MLDLHSKNTIIFSEIAQQKSHSSKFPQNATKSIFLFVPAEVDENNYFDNGFTPLGWKPLCEFYTVCTPMTMFSD